MSNREYQGSYDRNEGPYDRNERPYARGDRPEHDEGRFEGRQEGSWREPADRGNDWGSARDWDRRDDFARESGRSSFSQRTDFRVPEDADDRRARFERGIGHSYGDYAAQAGFQGRGNYGPIGDYRRPGYDTSRGYEGRQPDWVSRGEERGRGYDYTSPSYGPEGRVRRDPYRNERLGQGWIPRVSQSREGFGPEAWDARDADERYGRAEGESWGQQLRHAGQQVARNVKRVFRGPRGYKRSDERILEDVNERLAQQDEFDPSDLEVSVSRGEVTLAGSVQSRQEKFYAEELADEVSGVTDVHNQLRVRREGAAQTSSASQTTTPGIGQNEVPASASQIEGPRNRNARA